MYVITEYQYQQLRNTCKEAFVDEIGRQPLKEESQTTVVQQLKTEVAAKCNHALNPNYCFSKDQLFDMFREVLQLSAVY